jgi:hypothetical protein
MYCCTVRLSGAGPAAPPRPRHDVAWPSLNLDLFQAEIDGEAGPGPGPGSLGGADVAAVLRPDEQGGRASNLKGGWLLCRGHSAKRALLGQHSDPHRVGGPPDSEASQPASAMLARNSLRPGVKLTWKYASQTGGHKQGQGRYHN